MLQTKHQSNKNVLNGLSQLGQALRDSITYEQIKDLPEYQDKVTELKSKYGKGLGQDYNQLFKVVPETENYDKMPLFKEAANELGLAYRPLPMILHIGHVHVDIKPDYVLFSGIGKSARIETYSITKKQIVNALKETK